MLPPRVIGLGDHIFLQPMGMNVYGCRKGYVKNLKTARCVRADRPLGQAINAAASALQAGRTPPVPCPGSTEYDYFQGSCVDDAAIVAALRELKRRWMIERGAANAEAALAAKTMTSAIFDPIRAANAEAAIAESRRALNNARRNGTTALGRCKEQLRRSQAREAALADALRGATTLNAMNRQLNGLDLRLAGLSRQAKNMVPIKAAAARAAARAQLADMDGQLVDLLQEVRALKQPEYARGQAKLKRNRLVASTRELSDLLTSNTMSANTKSMLKMLQDPSMTAENIIRVRRMSKPQYVAQPPRVQAPKPPRLQAPNSAPAANDVKPLPKPGKLPPRKNAPKPDAQATPPRPRVSSIQAAQKSRNAEELRRARRQAMLDATRAQLELEKQRNGTRARPPLHAPKVVRPPRPTTLAAAPARPVSKKADKPAGPSKLQLRDAARNQRARELAQKLQEKEARRKQRALEAIQAKEKALQAKLIQREINRKLLHERWNKAEQEDRKAQAALNARKAPRQAVIIPAQKASAEDKAKKAANRKATQQRAAERRALAKGLYKDLQPLNAAGRRNALGRVNAQVAVTLLGQLEQQQADEDLQALIRGMFMKNA